VIEYGGGFLASPIGVVTGARILVADDDPDLLDVVAMALEQRGAVVIRASNGAEMIDRLADSGPFDLVVTDVAMPWLNGIGAVRAARTAGLRMSVIVMTALRDTSLRQQVDALGGGAALLSKPFGLDELEAVASNLLNRAADPKSKTTR